MLHHIATQAVLCFGVIGVALGIVAIWAALFVFITRLFREID